VSGLGAAVAARLLLREQLRPSRKELGDLDDTKRTSSELKEKIEAAGMPDR